MSTPKKMPPPYPRMGEIYRMIALALDTKGSNRDVDRLAREGDFDWQLLPEMTQTLIIKPLQAFDSELASAVSRAASHFFEDYIGLITTVELDGLSREQALPILGRDFFIPFGAEVLLDLQSHTHGPAQTIITRHETCCVKIVLEWLDQQAGQPIEKVAYPETVNNSRSGREMVGKWRRGENLPNLTSIKLFSQELESKSISKTTITRLRQWLLIARAIDFFESESPEPVRPIMLRHELMGRPRIDIGLSLYEENRKLVPEESRHLVETILLAFNQLARTTPKGPQDQEKSRQALEACEKLAQDFDPEGRTRYHFDWMHGRWCALSGKLEEALPHYEKAIKGASYRAGDQQKQIMHETLVIAGYLGRKVLIKQLKHNAIALGFFAEPSHDNIVDTWEIEAFRAGFANVFPPRGRFPQAPTDLPAGFLSEHIMFYDPKEGDKAKPDLMNLNKVIVVKCQDGRKRRKSQLQYFIDFNQFDKFKLILDYGADVDWLDEAGGSALLMAIQHTSCGFGIGLGSNDDRYLKCLLDRPHKKETLNSITKKKKLTPLICAIDHGNPNFIKQLIAMGSHPNQKARAEDMSPLYYAIAKIGEARMASRGFSALKATAQAESSHPMFKEINRRSAISNAFGEPHALNLDNKEMRIIQDCLMKFIAQSFDIAKVHAVCSVLLQCGASPNQSHEFPAPGRTPLMLAAEFDDVELFSSMIKNYRGDPLQKDAQGADCRNIAHSFRSQNVWRHMQLLGLV